MRLLAVALVALAARYQPADAPCTVRCAPTDTCPGDQTCGDDGYCHAPGDDTRCVGYAVAISLGGTGSGVVRSTPPGLDCDGTTGCTATFAAGTEVELVAAPGAGARLSTWTGACSGAGACRFTVAGDVTVGATFNQAARLAVTLDGARLGHGRVVSTPAGIDCPGTACAAAFDLDQSVVLTATAEAGSRLGGWTACPAAAGAACTVSLTGDATTTVQFIRTPRITVDVVGTTDYAIASAPAGVTCSGTTCAGVFDQGTAVTVTASDGAASRWKSWTGCGGATGPCAVTVDDADVALVATYRDLYAVAATAAGSGSGTLSATGLTCGGGACSGTYEATTAVTITASPAVGSRFAGWTGCDAVTGAGDTQCQLTVGGARSVQATFVRQRQLTIDLAGSGTGAVTIAGVGTCTADCTRTVDQGPVSLTAVADAGSRTGGFTGACVGAGATCTATITADGTVVASFVRQHTLTVAVAADLTVVTPAGPCVGPASCAATVDLGATVTLTATPGVPGQVVRWSTACSGATCAVTIAGDTAITVGLDGGHLIWSRVVRRAGDIQDIVHTVTAGPGGDVVMGGWAGGGAALDLGGTPLPMPDSWNAWVARYEADGAPRWSRRLATTGYADVTASCITTSGDVIIGGIAAGSLALDGTSISDTGRNDGWVARLDGATGIAEWMVKIGGPVPSHGFANDNVVGLACDGESAIVLFTVVGPTYQVADGPVVTNAPEILWGAARLDAGGHHVWSHQVIDLPPGAYNVASALAVGGGGVYVVGWYSATFDPGTGPIEPTYVHPSGFVVRYDATTGAPRWVRAVGNGSQQGAGDTGLWPHLEAAAVDATGAVVVGGYVDGNVGDRVNLGTPAAPVRVVVQGASELVVARYASDGTPLDGYGLGAVASAGGARIRALAVNGGDVIARGVYTTAALDIGGIALAGVGTSGQVDDFVARIAPGGTARWAHRLGPFGTADAAAMGVTAGGEVVIADFYSGDPGPYDALDLPAASASFDGYLMVLGR